MIIIVLVGCEAQTSKKKAADPAIYNDGLTSCPVGYVGYYNGIYCNGGGDTTYYTTPTPTPVIVPTFPPNTSSNCTNVLGTNKPSGENRTPWCTVLKRRGGYGWDSYNDYGYTDAFLTDSTLKVKITINSSPDTCDPSVGTIYKKAYGKLKFDLGMSADGGYNYFYPQADVTLDLGSSQIFDLSPYINRSCATGGNCSQFIRIQNVRSDHACTYYGCPESGDSYCQYVCPSEWTLPSSSCWSVEMQVSTDNHQDLY